MATTITINGSVTLDESSDLQNTGIAVGTEDNNDNDVSLATLLADASTFYNRLFGVSALNLSTTFDSDNGVARSASNFITVSSSGTITDLGFVDGSGGAIPVYDGTSLGSATGLLTTSGGAISLFLDQSLGNDMVLGVVTNGTEDKSDDTIAFALFLQSTNLTNTAARVWMTQFTALKDPDASDPDDQIDLFDSIGVSASVLTTFDFSTLPSGQNLFGMVGDATSAMVVFGKSPVLNADGTYANPGSNTINTSQGGGATTIGVNNQMFDPGDGAYFTYVKGADSNFTSSNLDANEADDADNMLYSGGTIEATTAFLKVVQIQGGSPASLSIKAFNIAGSPQGQALVAARGTGSSPSITQIIVKDANGATVQTINNPTANQDGSYTVNSVSAGYTVQWTTSAVHDQVLITGVSGKFDIGGFGVLEASSQSVDIGAQVQFEDDGPTQTLALQEGAEVRVDESLGQNGAPETEGAGAGLGQVTVSRAALFDITTDFGTDGPASSGSIAWSLKLSNEGADSGLDRTSDGANVLLYTEAGTGDVLGKVGSDVVFRVSINSSGDVTLTQYQAMVHGDPTDPDEADTPLSVNSGLIDAVRVIKDGDLDPSTASADIGPALKFEDDGPTQTLALKSDAEVRVDESLGQNGSPETEGGAAGLGQVTVARAVLFDITTDFGQDGQAGSGAILWSLALSAEGADSGLDTTAGANVLLYTEAGTGDILGKDGSTVVLRVHIASNGDVTLTQYESLKHPETNDADEALAPLNISSGLVSAVRTIKDGDLDPDSKSADIGPALKFEDDGPGIGPISNGLVDFTLNSSVTHTLNGAVGQDENSTPYTLIAPYTTSVTINGVVLNAVLSANGQQISYWANTNNNGVFGDAGDTEFYRLTLDETANSGAGSYTFTVLQNPPPAFQEFNFDNLPSGQNLFGTVGTTSSALIVIGGHPALKADGTMTNASDTINTSQGGGNVTIGVTNQMFDPGESAFFTLVKNPNASFLAGAPGGLDQNEADDADNMLYTGGTNEVSGAFVKIVQIQGNSLGTMDIQCYNIPGAPQGQSLALSNLGSGTSPAITDVRVFDALGHLIESFSSPVANNAVTISITNGVARVAGLDANYKVEFDTSANAKFDQVKITDVAGKFDVGAFGINVGQDTPDQLLSFTAKVIDGDGDFGTAAWKIGIDGTGAFDDGSVLGL